MKPLISTLAPGNIIPPLKKKKKKRCLDRRYMDL